MNKRNFGAGVLLDPVHFEDIKLLPQVDWFELMIEELIGFSSNQFNLRIDKDYEFVIANYPVTLHGVELSIGSIDPFDKNYLKQLKKAAEQVNPFLISDHLCWTGANGQKYHELLPLPYTKKTLDYLVSRVNHVQDYLERQIALENPPSYVQYTISDIEETDFFNELHRRTGCGMLLDLNNLYVASQNNKFDAKKYISSLEPNIVSEIHLAGYENFNNMFVDTHSTVVLPPVWNLYKYFVKQFGEVSTCIEWDLNKPTFKKLQNESQKAKRFLNEATQ